MFCEKVKKMTWAERFARLQFIIQNITLEPIIALNAMANSMQNSAVLQDLAMVKYCVNDYEQNLENCTHVTNATLRQNLSGSVAYYQFYRQCLELGPCIFVALFLGTWSDTYGRKLLILIPLLGDTLSCANYTLQSYFINTNVFYLLFGSAIQGVCGGDLIFNMATQSFVIELSTARTRTLRIAMVEVGVLFGAPIGAMVGGALHTHYGFVPVFFTAFVLNCTAMAYAVIRLRKVPLVKQVDKGRPFRDLFRTDNLVGSFQIFRKKREGRKRLYILLTAIGLWMLMFPRYGNMSIYYLYTHIKFNYTVAQYSLLFTVLVFSVGLGDLVLVPLLSYVLKLRDATLGTIATLVCIVAECMIAFAVSPLMMYLASIPLTFVGSAGIAGRSLLSECVELNELGRLLSVLGCIYAFGPIVAGLVYAKVFNATMKTFIGSCYLISAGINLFTVFIYAWIFYDLNRTTKKSAANGKVEKVEDGKQISSENHVNDEIVSTYM